MTERNTKPLYVTWKAALRSGQYTQADGRLFDGTGYCCLGVGEKVCLGLDFYMEEDSDGHPTGWWRDEYGGDELLEPTPAAQLGLDVLVTEEDMYTLRDAGYRVSSSMTVVPGVSPRQNILAAANDAGYTFPEIADLIELLGWDKEEENNA